MDPSDQRVGVGTEPAVATATPDGRTRTVELRAPLGPGADVGAFLIEHGANFGLGGDVSIVAAGELEFGPGAFGRVVVYQAVQGPNSTPVYGAELKVIVIDGEVRYVASSVPRLRPLGGGEPAMSADEVLDTLGARIDAGALLSPPQLVVYDPAAVRDSVQDGRGGEGALAYRIEATDLESGEPTEFFVSAHSGEVIDSTTLVRTARRRRVRDARGQTELPPLLLESESTAWFDELGMLSDISPPPDMSSQAYRDAELAYDHLGQAYDFWFELLGWDGMDGRGGEVFGFVNFASGTPLERSNAYHVPYTVAGLMTEAIVFNPGTVVLDSTLHEYAHGVLNSIAASNLANEGEPGAVNEGLSDTFAAFATPGPTQWQIGEDLPRGVGRDVENGTTGEDTGAFCYAMRFGQPGALECDDVQCTEPGWTCIGGSCQPPSWDHGGVHANGAILMRALYLASVGSAAATEPPPACTTDIEVVAVEQRKLAYALAVSLVLLETHSTLHDAAANAIAACRLVAATTFVPPGASGTIEMGECSSLRNAFAAVGLATPDRDYDGLIDTQDNCPRSFNPDQDPDACASQMTGGAYPTTPPVEPACPESFTSSYSHEGRGIEAGTWPLREPNDADRSRVWTAVAQYADGDRGGSWFRKVCSYGVRRDNLQVVSFTLYWQPYDPALYEPFEAYTICEHDAAVGEPLGSETHQARITVSADCSLCPLIDESDAVAAAMLSDLEALAQPCP